MPNRIVDVNSRMRSCLLSPAYLLSYERWPFHAGPPITKADFVPAEMSLSHVKLPYAFALNAWFPIRLREPLQASVTVLEATAQSNYPPDTVSQPDNGVD